MSCSSAAAIVPTRNSTPQAAAADSSERSSLSSFAM
jgi:hypothetical protein